MAYILSQLLDVYSYLNDEVSDPRVKDWLFMKNPFSMILILVLYLNFVLKWGPKLMKNRKPIHFDNLMVVYNAIQIVACFHLTHKAFKYAYMRGYSMTCQAVDYSDNPDSLEIAGGVHMYFLLKVADLLDTVFFVLRKKDKQISFLHVYHHTGMVVLTWNATKFFPGGHSIFTGFINSIIHVVMYAYYLVTAFSPKYKNNVWWKKYITQMQIVQFFMIMVHWSALLFDYSCNFPRWPVAVMIPQNFFMVALFSDFYRKAYLKPKIAKIENISKEYDVNHNTETVSDNYNKSKPDNNGELSNGINNKSGLVNGKSNGTSNGKLVNGNLNGALNKKSNIISNGNIILTK